MAIILTAIMDSSKSNLHLDLIIELIDMESDYKVDLHVCGRGWANHHLESDILLNEKRPNQLHHIHTHTPTPVIY